MAAIDIEPSGIRMFNPFPVTDGVANMRGHASKNALTAKAGGGQATATQLLNGLNRVTVVATNDDSVQLPAAISGTIVGVMNADAAQSIKVFGKNGRTDTIDGTAGATGVNQAAGNQTFYVCYVDTVWNRLVGA